MNAVKLFYAKYIKRWVKALGSAVGGALAGLLINWVQGTTPIPTTQKELYTLLLATLLPPILTLFAPANKITQKQLDQDPNVIGGVVVPDAQVPPSPPTGQRKSSWQ
jgi:hypothetical protein